MITSVNEESFVSDGTVICEIIKLFSQNFFCKSTLAYFGQSVFFLYVNVACKSVTNGCYLCVCVCVFVCLFVCLVALVCLSVCYGCVNVCLVFV